MKNATVIEDIYSSAAPVSKGLGFDPRSYVPPQSTFQTFRDNNFDNVQTNAAQSSAIRGKVASPSIYEWNAASTQAPKQQAPQQSQQPLFSFDPVQNVRNAISSCYSGAQMLKTQQSGEFSVYKCPVENMTGGDYKYIVAIVGQNLHSHIPLGAYYSLASIPWVSFQTRATSNPAAEFGPNRPTPLHYSLPHASNNPLFDKIKLVLEEPTKFSYIADTIPCKVEFLKMKETSTAASSSTVISALEGFKTILTFMN
jgi:hypothetical protein